MVSVINRQCMLGLCLLGASLTLHAAPAVTSASGSASPGSVITISGSGFGATGPKIVMFDDFERGSVGQSISMGAPIGAWTDAADSPIFSSDARTGKAGFLAYDASAGRARQLRLDLGGDHTEVFVSFWVRVPDGTHYPGRDVSGPGQFSSDSSWKFTWLMDSSEGYTLSSRFDMFVPAHAGGGYHIIAGNDGNFAYPGKAWWSWNSWMRISYWIRGGASLPSSSASSGYFQVVSQEKGYSIQDFATADPFAPSASNKFNVLNVPGWIRTGIIDNRIKPAHDDIYVAAGRGAVARVELGNASTYTASKTLSIVPTQTWLSDRITAKVPQAGVGSGTTWYLYVTDADGKTNTTGFPLNCSDCKTPSAPTNVSVQ